MTLEEKNALVDYLRQFITENKWRKFYDVLQYRTRMITVAIENVYQPQNASAVIRTCDCLGIQDLHVIENENAYHLNPNVTRGASKWVDIHRYSAGQSSTLDCIQKLRENGYRIVATTPHRDDFELDELPLEGKMAFLFGKENLGLSGIALENSDQFVRIPMVGFTESYNLSVSAAIVLYSIMQRLRKSNVNLSLSNEEIVDLKLKWLRKLVRRHAVLEEEFYRKFSSGREER